MNLGYFQITDCDKDVLLFIDFLEVCRLHPYKKYKTLFTTS